MWFHLNAKTHTHAHAHINRNIQKYVKTLTMSDCQHITATNAALQFI